MSRTSTARTTEDGGLAALAFSLILSGSVGSVLCIIVSEQNLLPPTSNTCSARAIRLNTQSNDDARTT